MHVQGITWHTVTLEEEQFAAMRKLSVEVLGLTPLVEQEGWSLLPMSNGTILDLTDCGHVERVPNPADGRSYLVKLTPDGRRIVARGRPLVGAVFRRVEPHLARPAAEYVECSRELRHALAVARDAAAERRAAAA